MFQDVKCSGNWMWAAKLPGEGACLWDACKAMCEVMGELGVAIDGGKDSLSMAARVGKDTVKAPGALFVCECDCWWSFCRVGVFSLTSALVPGALVISAYAVCPDITATVTPDLQDPDGKGNTHIESNRETRLIETTCLSMIRHVTPFSLTHVGI